MVPSPRRQNPQRQRLTVALRKVCKDYPAGAGVLRELLQNADDAGASYLHFILDTRNHPSSPTLVPGLSEYQGPALLAHNDALFSEQDFRSLASLGDSMKVHEKATTGKFGLGFSSVYNWTDCPSVLSGSTLLFLDPHHSWSQCFNPPGGPDYDFPIFAKDEAMANQLRCFSLVNTEWDRPFEGTIIRIPLRNGSQAKQSEISSREASIEDIRHSMKNFTQEIGSDGLLFLRAVKHILLSTDNEQLNEVEIANRCDLVEPKSRLASNLENMMSRKDPMDSEVYYEIHLRHWAEGEEIARAFGVLNFVMGSVPDSSLDKWAASQKLFPWVAIAAPLTDADGSWDLGQLYSVLPLSILTRLPVHIHGCFSISADRSRLHGPDDRGVQDKRPESWNRFLFNDVVPITWAKLLLHVCQSRQRQNFFHLWPGTNSTPGQWWHGLIREVMDTVSRNGDPVWFTEFGYVSMKHGLLASLSTSPRQKQAFREVELRAVYLPDHLLNEAQKIRGSRSLSPSTLHESLLDSGSSSRLTNESKLVVLEYLANKIPLQDLTTLEIFPFGDGQFRSLTSLPVFLHRDNLERELFARHLESSLDTDRLSSSTTEWIHRQARCNDVTVRYRTLTDLREYFLKFVISGSSDTVVCGEEERSLVGRAWDWIVQHHSQDLPLAEIGPLWLVPVRDSGIRKLVPTDSSNSATWFDSGRQRDIALQILAPNSSHGPKLIENGSLSDTALESMLSYAKKDQSLRLRDGKKLGDFVQFLSDARIQLGNATGTTKELVFRAIDDLYRTQHDEKTDLDKNLLRSLCIFQEVEWPVDAKGPTAMVHCWVDLTKDATFVGVRDFVPVPWSSDRVFIDATEERTCSLLRNLNLVKCLDKVQILEQVVIPALQDGSYSRMSSSIRLHVSELLFQNYLLLCPSVQASVPKLTVVPLEKKGVDNTSIFGCPADVIDPREPSLVRLYFGDERKSPETRFRDRFFGVLTGCGMIKRLTSRLILDRIRTYEQKKCPFMVVASRSKNLLQLPLMEDIAKSEEFTQSIKSCRWLPAKSPEGAASLTNAWKCRDSDDSPLVGRMWCILPFRVEKSWKPILGWQDDIPADILMSQIEKSINAYDLRSVEQTLDYLSEHHSTDDYQETLDRLAFIWSSRSSFVRPAEACRGGAEKLMPYLCNVDPRFWKDHVQILQQVKVPKVPDIARLHSVQKTLELKGALSEADLDVAVEIAQLWDSRVGEAVKSLKVPDDQGFLRSVGSLVFNDAPWVSDMDCALAHPKLSRASADRLGMQPVSDLLRKGELGLSDFDEDEFNQREDVTDGIKDTLDRYTRNSTFHEYLANADDCGSASAVNFLLDETNYKTEHLLTPDLCSFQGPALLIHNDGVFTESDFEGLKHVGRGSKRDDPTTIGKFGRGSQTMYHWTDVPMILSGDHLVILDPQRKYLPLNYRTRQKKPGVKIQHAKLRTTCPDQLAPFEGLWSFNRDHDHYNGTIFRFPLRINGSKSELMESIRCPDLITTVQTFHDCLDDARQILLFLRNIKCVDFGVRHKASSNWRVSRGQWPESSIFSDWAVVKVQLRNDQGTIESSQRWWRAMVDVYDVPPELQNRHKRRMKHVECGIAAPVVIKEKAMQPSLTTLKAKFSNCVPLKFESTLPVQIHASFLLSGDRQNIATDETSQEAGSDWNKWLLTNKIPQVYLQFLEDLGRKIGHDVYDYFPVEHNKGHQHLSNLVRKSFWAELDSCRHRLFPVVEAYRVEDKKGNTALRPKNRQAPHLTEPGHALFDLLDKKRSQVFGPLLSNCAENLVCPPVELSKHLKAVSHFNFVTPSLVRRILKSERAVQYVEGMLRTDPRSLSVLLSFIRPESDDDLVELDGCSILPLMDGNLATLSLMAEGTKGINHGGYFFASATRRQMFSFASSYFVRDEGNELFVQRVLQSGRFNLRTFQKCHVGSILKCSKTWTDESLSRSWLLGFWKWMNSTSEHLDKPDLESLEMFPLLLCRTGDKEVFKSLRSFQNSAVVLDAQDESHRRVYQDFTDLGVIDRETIQKSILDREGSLGRLEAMGRFLRGLGILAKGNAQSVTVYARSRLKKESMKTLRSILMRFPQASVASLQDVVNDLPVWKSIAPTGDRLTAKQALAAADCSFVVPWMKHYGRFTQDTDVLGMQKIDSVSLLRDYVLPYMPKLLDAVSKPSYIQFVRGLSLDPTLTQFAARHLAANQDGELCPASHLYDHTEAVFAAAFRSEAPKKFLMTEARVYLSLWRRLGLRHQRAGQFRGPDYLASLQALERRLSRPANAELRADVQVVLAPLCTNDDSLKDLDGSTWRAIRKLLVFQATATRQSDPEHRRVRMADLALRKPVLSMDDLIRRKFIAVCWSQTGFALHEPSSFLMEASGLDKQPRCATVWQHLAFLADCGQSIDEANITGFISDVQKTYEFLLVNQQESKITFNQPDAPIWLNVEVTDSTLITVQTLRSSWTSLEQLILYSPCSAPPLSVVHPFLGRFSSLLEEIGCTSVHYPSIAAASCHQSEPAFAAIREMREKGILNDVRFRAEGRMISAHKVVLASRSLYCQRQFGGCWDLRSDGRTDSPVVDLEDMTYATLKILLDYCYDEQLDWASDMQVQKGEDLSVNADKLDALLDIVVAADRWLMPDLHLDAQRQIILGNRFFVRPDNVEDVAKVAGEANAWELKNYCVEFMKQNAKAVLLASA